MLKLCVYGVAGSGKSTASAMIERILTDRGLSVEIIKLARPLYRLQQHIYETAGEPTDLWTHDNELLRLLATQLRRINPHFLVEDFLARVASSTSDAVVNDDLRNADVDYPRMLAAGFRFLHVSCGDEVRGMRLKARGDVTVVPDSAATWGFDRIAPDWTIDNSSEDPGYLNDQVTVVLDKWLQQRRPL